MKNNNLKISILVVGIAMVIGFIYFIVTMKDEQQDLEQESIILENELAQRDSAYNEAVDLLFGIEAEVERIKNRENIISNRSLNEHDGYSENQIVEDMRAIDSLIVSANTRISHLLHQLELSDIDLNSFKRRMSQLNKELQDRTRSIALLKEDLKTKEIQIAGLEDNVESLEKENEQQLVMISDQMNQLLNQDLRTNTAYIAIGTRDQLEEKQLIKREGGFLGLGRTTGLADNAIIENFSQIDIRATEKLYIDAMKVDLVTDHPTNSFKLISNGKNISHIEITDPEEFWKLSNYLVIAIKS